MDAPAPLSMSLVYPSDSAQPLVRDNVSVLVESIKAIGLHTPITVRPVKRFADGREIDAFEIVAGRHRFEAARSLGWREIDAVVWTAEADDAELWEIDENFARRVLTDAQRANNHLRREAILVRKGLVAEPGKGGDRSNGQNVRSYSAQAGEALGVDARTVRRDLRRAKNIDPDVLAEVTGTPLDSGVVLDELAALPRADQPARLQVIRNERMRSTVQSAPDPLNDLEATEKQLAALMAAWNRAGADARRKFMDRVDEPVFDRRRA